MVDKLFKMHHKIKLQLDAICQEAGDMNVEEFMQVYKSLEQGRDSELQMKEARTMAEQYKFAMPNPSGIDRNFQEDMINDMDMGQDETIERTYY